MDWKADFDNAFSAVFLKRNLLALVSLWFGIVLLLVVYGTLGGSPDRGEPCIPLPVAGLEVNETGAMFAQRQAARIESRVSYRAMLDNLCAQDNAAGVFRTASGKQVRIENLQVVFYPPEGPLASDVGAGVRWGDFHDLFAPRRSGRCSASRLGILDEFQAGAADWSTSLDLANAAEVQIRNLDWRIGVEEAPALRVQCRYAHLRADTPRITLRGHVIVQTRGVTLEGNHIEMNLRDEYFRVLGRYQLTCPEGKEMGFGARLDRALRPLDGSLPNTGENERWANGLPPESF